MALVRLILRPAPCAAEFKDATSSFPFTMNPGAVIEPGIIPNTFIPAGVGPFRWTITSFPSTISFHAKLWWFSITAIGFSPIALRYLFMNSMMTGRGVISRKIHCQPIFHSFFSIQIKLCQVLCFAWQDSFLHSNLCVMRDATVATNPRLPLWRSKSTSDIGLHPCPTEVIQKGIDTNFFIAWIHSS